MKTINVNGREFQYKVGYDCSEYGDYYWTDFYEGTETETYKKWLFFGPTLTKEVGKWVFKVYLNIENPHLTKSEIRQHIERAVELLERKEEIERGEII